jgi:3-oxoacyl-[acyl-carrier protein] reductase
LALAKRGARLALIARQSKAQDETEALLRELGADFQTFYAELSAAVDCIDAAEKVLRRAGTPAAVIHNAATIERSWIQDTSTETFETQLNVNLRAPFLLTRQWLPAMRRAGEGRLVFVSSVSATLGTAGAAAYCASKWGLVGFVKSLAEELKDSGLMALSVLPGSVDTRMLHDSGFEPRITPQEVACTLVHYALDAPLAHNGAIVEMFGV